MRPAARIAFCWELGRGLGHLTPYLPLIRKLSARGDEVLFLGKDHHRVAEVFADLPIEAVAIESGFTAPADQIRGADSYPEVLYNCGFNDAEALSRRVNHLGASIREIAPDVLIADFAPTVMLANRILGLPLVAAGNGFQLPVKSIPMPRFRYWQGAVGQSLQENETRVLEIVNLALTDAGGPPLDSIATLLQADCEWLRTFAELDFYGRRDGERYLGAFPADHFGQPPQWPATGDPRVFAYLTPGPATSTALRALVEAGAAVCLYAPELAAAERSSLDHERICVAADPVDITAVARDSGLFVTNGNLNTVAAALLAGKAQLALPTSAEKYL
ncbi:MAG TPA: hypothetical protein QF901_08115, partial [Gammaproteobacteria bacterium]|nr:hypothetical protein [Gammaproteobacteria bacterium]